MNSYTLLYIRKGAKYQGYKNKLYVEKKMFWMDEKKENETSEIDHRAC